LCIEPLIQDELAVAEEVEQRFKVLSELHQVLKSGCENINISTERQSLIFYCTTVHQDTSWRLIEAANGIAWYSSLKTTSSVQLSNKHVQSGLLRLAPHC